METITVAVGTESLARVLNLVKMWSLSAPGKGDAELGWMVEDMTAALDEGAVAEDIVHAMDNKTMVRFYAPKVGEEA